MNTIEKKVLSYVNEKEVAEFCQSLIRCNSCYPPGDTRSVADVCKKKLEAESIDVQLVYPPSELPGALDDGVDNSRIPSVIATYAGGPGKHMVWNAHIDQVPVEDITKWRHDPFSGCIEEENGVKYVYGRGAGDDKGSVCAQVMALIALKRAGVKLKGTLIVNPVADEEGHGLRGTKYLLDSGYYGNPDYVIIGEQTNDEVAVADRAYTFSRIIIKGRACHGAMPWNGNNAIVKAAKVIERLNCRLEPQLEKRTHPYTPHSTLDISMIKGGVKENVCPELCEITFDRRIVAGETLQGCLDEIESIVKEVQAECSEDPFDYEMKYDYLSGMGTNTDPREPMVVHMLSATEELTGKKAEPTGYMQGCDARFFAPFSVPTVIYGPSDPAVGHSPDERVSIEQLVQAVKVYAVTAIRTLGVEEGEEEL